MRLYYLGPKGTFSYLAAKTYLSEEEVTYSPKSNLYEVIKAVNSHSDAVGIVPIENSIEGTINIVGCTCTRRYIRSWRNPFRY